MQPNEMGDVPVVHSEHMPEEQLVQISAILDSPGIVQWHPVVFALRAETHSFPWDDSAPSDVYESTSVSGNGPIMHLTYATLSTLSRCLPLSQPLHSLTPVLGYLSDVLLLYVIGYVAVT